MTALDLVNRVLRRLRETEVVDFTESYTKLILDFVNETKREVEDAWDWTALRTTLTVTTDTSNRSYSIVGAGQRYRFLRRDGTDNVSAYNTTHNGFLNLVSNDSVQRTNQMGLPVTGIPMSFALSGQDTNLDPIIVLTNIPTASSILKFNMVVPQADLNAITDILTVPWYPVMLGTWARAISERGEDGGQNTIEQEGMYSTSLSDAISQDAAKTGGETIWGQV